MSNTLHIHTLHMEMVKQNQSHVYTMTPPKITFDVNVEDYDYGKAFDINELEYSIEELANELGVPNTLTITMNGSQVIIE